MSFTFLLAVNDAAGRPRPVAAIVEPGLVHDLALYSAESLESDASPDPLRRIQNHGRAAIMRAVLSELKPRKARGRTAR